MISRKDIWWVEEVFDDDTIQIVNDNFKVKPSKEAFDEANRMDFIELSRLRLELQGFIDSGKFTVNLCPSHEEQLILLGYERAINEINKRFRVLLEEK